MATHQAGRYGKVTVGVTDLEIRGWTREETIGTEDTTNTGSGGFRDSVDTIKEASGTVEADWDVDAPPTDDPPNIRAGTEAALELYIGDPANDKKFTHAKVVIVGVPTASEVRGKVSYSFNWESRGSWTYPS